MKAPIGQRLVAGGALAMVVTFGIGALLGNAVA